MNHDFSITIPGILKRLSITLACIEAAWGCYLETYKNFHNNISQYFLTLTFRFLKGLLFTPNLHGGWWMLHQWYTYTMYLVLSRPIWSLYYGLCLGFWMQFFQLLDSKKYPVNTNSTISIKHRKVSVALSSRLLYTSMFMRDFLWDNYR